MYEFAHDSESRTSLGRETVRIGLASDKTCDFCGQVKKTPLGAPYLYRYFALSDGGSRAPLKGLFCSVDCCRAYHGFSK